MSTLNDLISQSFDIRGQRRELEAEVNELKKVEKAIDDQITQIMQKEGLDTSGIKGVGNVAVKLETVPSEIDWDEMIPFMFQHPELLYRRINAGAYRDLLEAEIDVPGAKPATIVKLSKRVA